MALSVKQIRTGICKSMGDKHHDSKLLEAEWQRYAVNHTVSLFEKIYFKNKLYCFIIPLYYLTQV